MILMENLNEEFLNKQKTRYGDFYSDMQPIGKNNIFV